ncbi:hypothetical protein HK097_006431 [Rhizophlyctis rosea]|uniref:protein disulfide-isomerase n=1 Tax=Rhizophlyctis rosea TaxID=64517 RepID=A0AAD5X4R6_9FUNG|nr:hypothetical protein HK097_006431 [Rhizophlyctis rosea]
MPRILPEWRMAFWLLTVTILASSVSALYSKRDAVITADSKNWQQEVLDTDHVVLAEFFAPWCGHCQRLTPEYKKAAEKLKGLAKVVAVDCDQDKNKPLCGQYGIQGFPTIKLFGTGKKGMPEDYNGPRAAKGLVDAAIAKIRGYVTPIGGTGKKAATYEDFIAKDAGKLAKVILVSAKPSTPPLFKALSTEYRNRLSFGEVKSSQKEIVEKLKVENFPAVIVVPKEEGAEPVVYEGAMKFAALSEFFDKYAAAGKVKSSKSSKATEEEPAAKKQNAAPFDPTIPELKSQSDLTHHCLTNTTICAVTFLILEPNVPESVSQHTTDLAVLQSLKKKYHASHPDNPITFTWVNAVDHGSQLIRDFGVSDMYPALLLFTQGRKVYWRYMGAWEEKGVEGFLKDSLAGGTGRNRFRKYEFEPQLDKGVRAKVVEKAEEVKEKVESATEKVKREAPSKVEEVEETVKSVVEDVKEKVESVTEQVKVKVSEATEKAQSVADEVKEKVVEATQSVKDEL